MVSSQSEESAAAAEFFLSIGQADMAEEEFAFALAGDPRNVHYFNRLGMAFRRQKKFSEAVLNYKKALQVDPNNTVTHFNLALALAAMKDYTTACTTLRKALVNDINFKDAEILLKKIQREMQKNKSAGNGHANGRANGKH